MENATVLNPDRLWAEGLVDAVSAAEAVIIATVERECDALRAGQMLAARALHTRLCDAVKVYVQASRAVRASLAALESALPGSGEHLEDRRQAFSALLKLELAVLAAERAACGEVGPATSFTGETLVGFAPAEPPPQAARGRGTAERRAEPGQRGLRARPGIRRLAAAMRGR